MLSEKAEKIFKMKYAKGEESWEQMCYRVANHVAQAEVTDELQDEYFKKFYNLLYNKIFIPGGRILANSGTGISNLMNCLVLGIEDSRNGIYDTLKNAAELFAHGYGIGYNFSNLREEGATIKSAKG